MVLLVLVVLVLAGCSVRLDLPPPPVPTADHEESIRQEQARAVTTVLDLIESGDAEGTELSAVGEHAAAHLEALGGVWEPPPRPDDPPVADTDVDRDAAIEDVVAALEESAGSARAGAAEVSADLAVLLISIATNHTLHAQWLREVADLEAADTTEPAPDPHPATVGPEASELVRVLDASGYVAELRAARTRNQDGEQWQERAEQMRALADLLATRGGFAGTQDDPRHAAYDVDLDDLAAEADALEGALVPAWLQLAGPADAADRQVIAARVLESASGAHNDAGSLPAFPGHSQ